MTTKLILLTSGKPSGPKPDDLIPAPMDNFTCESVALVLTRAVLVMETDRQWTRAALLDAHAECLRAVNGNRMAPEY